MKSYYLILFVALIACSNCFDFSTLVCLITNEKIKNEAMKVYDAIQTQDIQNIIVTVWSAYLSVKDEFDKCLEPTPSLRALEVVAVPCSNEEEYGKCRERCTGMLNMLCKKDCYNLWCLNYEKH